MPLVFLPLVLTIFALHAYPSDLHSPSLPSGRASGRACPPFTRPSPALLTNTVCYGGYRHASHSQVTFQIRQSRSLLLQ